VHCSRQTALHVGVKSEGAVEQLLELGAKCDAVDAEGWTPLHTVCATDKGFSFNSAEYLLEAGADPKRFTNITDRSSSSTSSSDAEEHMQGGWQLLHHAVVNYMFEIEEHHTGTVTTVTSAGVDIDALTLNDCTGLWLLARCHEEQYTYAHERLVALVDEEGASLHVRTPKGWSLLHAAAAAGGVTVLQLLLDRGLMLGEEVYYADDYDSDDDDDVDRVNVGRTNGGATVLHCAVRGGHVPMVKLLLAQQCDAFATDTAGHTALHYCLQAPVGPAVTECFELLIEAGCDPLATAATTG
jgi:ankyrin repeat protein